MNRKYQPPLETPKTPPPYVQRYDSTTYQGLELRPYTGRPGCNDALSCPSRVGRYRYYRDGRVEVEES